MARGEEAVRREAVARRMAGESPEAIGRSLGRTRQWVARWARRYDADDPNWARERSRAAGRVANRTPPELEAQVLAVRDRLEANPWAQIGAEAIAWELEKLGITAPSTRTIERILAREGRVRTRRRQRYEPKGTPYPQPPAESPGDLVQADIVGPRHLDGGIPFIALNAVDVASHAVAIEIVDEQREGLLCNGAVCALARLGLPRRLQLDNGKPFLVGGGRLGEFVRMVCWQGVIPVFIPQGEPWRNGVCERFNDTFDQRFYRSERFASRAAVRERALAFERFHNANHRYRATGRRTPDEVRRGLAPRSPTALAELPAGWPSEGRIEFIRFIRSDRKLRLLRRQITVPKQLVYRYVTAAVDLAVPPQEGNLRVADHDGEVVMSEAVELGR